MKNRKIRKAVRDLLVVGLSAILIALAESAGDFGLPPAVIPIVSAGALWFYRWLREGVPPLAEADPQ